MLYSKSRCRHTVKTSRVSKKIKKTGRIPRLLKLLCNKENSACGFAFRAGSFSGCLEAAITLHAHEELTGLLFFRTHLEASSLPK